MSMYGDPYLAVWARTPPIDLDTDFLNTLPEPCNILIPLQHY